MIASFWFNCFNLLGLSLNDQITDDDLIDYCTNLSSLDLCDNTVISNRALKFLTNLTQIQLLNDIGDINYEGIQFLTKLTSISLYGNQSITLRDLRDVASNVTHLDIGENGSFTDSCLLHFSNLTHLNLSVNSLITDDSLQILTKVSLNHQLKFFSAYLFIEFANIKLIKLEMVSNYTITNDGIRYLTNLTYLDVKAQPENSPLSERGIKSIRKKLTTLRCDVVPSKKGKIQCM